MTVKSKKYWNSVEQLTNDPKFVESAKSEFPEEVSVADFMAKDSLGSTNTSRRDFLKFMGFSLTAATLAACETPVTKSIPYVVKPEVITPGVANWYASSFFMDGVFASVVVKTREGRPIFILGNKKSPITKGATDARITGSVLGLYDSNRYSAPMLDGNVVSFDDLDAKMTQKLQALSEANGSVAIISGTLNSPSAKKAIEDFKAKYGTEEGGLNVEHVQYDPISFAGMRNANAKNFGKSVIPSYDFSKAKTIVSFGADFLGDWPMGMSYTKDYSVRRNPDGEWMSRHFQFETNMSITGSNADVRGAIRPSDEGQAVIALYNAIAKSTGASTVSGGSIKDDDNAVATKIQNAAKELLANKGASLVVSGSNDENVQSLVNGINQMLSNYGQTIDLDTPVFVKQGDDKAFADVVSGMKAGKYKMVMIWGVNPAYSAPASLGFAESLQKVETRVSFADRPDETSTLCNVNAPDKYFLESWGDANPVAGQYGLTQPTINPLFKSREAAASLLAWSGNKTSYVDYIKANWIENIFPSGLDPISADNLWNTTLQNGYYVSDSKATTVDAGSENEDVVGSGSYTDMSSTAASALNKISAGEWEMTFYTKTGIGEGTLANNPHLQELPDPISKVSWDNYITMNPKDMETGGYEIKLGQETPANVAEVTVGDAKIKLPVVPVPGQKKGTVSVAVGYGRQVTGKAGKGVGKNVYPLIQLNGETMSFSATNVGVAKAEGTFPIASVQTHHTMMGRKIVNEVDLTTYKTVDKNDKKNGWNKDLVMADAFGVVKPIDELDLWNKHDIEKGHRWGMSIDLNACLGCGACVTACHIENNVPVVGKDEIRRTRSMHWLRIDRYFSSAMTEEVAEKNGIGAIDKNKQMEDPEAYPEVVFQPVMCQHCNHAPCETVCPVAATTHSNEGLNQMTYNRCIGTRYCANNCPYKVRRFNWFNYTKDPKFTGINPANVDDLTRMVLNPDVVVRSRGVIEKCSFCVQHIQAGKLKAKKAGRPVKDGEVTSACAAACSTGAIKFGDLNDKNSAVHKGMNHDRAYNLIAEIGTKPNVYYQTKVRNVEETIISEESTPAEA